MSEFSVNDAEAAIAEGLKKMELSPELQEDHNFIMESLPEAAIVSLTQQFLTMIIMRTAYSRVQLRIQIPEKYPVEAPIVELSSPTLPPPLLRNKEKECREKAKELTGKPQVAVIFNHINDFIQTNMFIPCWKEMKQVVAMGEKHGVKFGCDEKTGEISIRAPCKKYRNVFSIKVPLLYPEQGVSVEFKGSNFPEDIQHMFKAQTDEIVRRCEAGFSPEEALKKEVNLEAATKKSTERKVRLDTGALKNLKHDVNALKQIADLRQKTQVTAIGWQGGVVAERREARKELRRLAKAENKIDEAFEAEMRELEQAEMKELLKTQISDTAQPSLFAVARFLIEDYAIKLPNEACQACDKLVFADEPDSTEMRDRSHKQRPMRTFCGHWFHYHCLNEWLTTPPFIRNCKICDRRIWHPDWPDDVKKIEKAWQNKETKKREMADVADLMGF